MIMIAVNIDIAINREKAVAINHDIAVNKDIAVNHETFYCTMVQISRDKICLLLKS